MDEEGSEGKREERTGSRVRKCKRKDCGDTFTSKRELRQHMVSIHHYLSCPHPHCSKVFQLQARLNKHFPIHGLPFPSAETLRTESTVSTEDGNVMELTRDTLEYLREIGKLMKSAESKAAGVARLSSQLLSGIAQEPHYASDLALYLHALEAAFSLPTAPNCLKPSVPATILQENWDFQPNRAKIAISIPISALTPPSPEPKASERAQNLLFHLHRRELKRKRRKTERFTIEKEEYRRYKPKKMYKTDAIPEEQSFLPIFQPFPEAETALERVPMLICIEEPCNLRFCSAKDLVEHLEAAHYQQKAL